MPANQVTDHVFFVLNGDAKVFLIDHVDGLVLIDTGFPGTMALIEEALRERGRTPRDICDVLVTHCHPDHAGGLAEVVRATGAKVWMHPADAEMVSAGQAFRPWEVTPGEHNEAFVAEVIRHAPSTFEAVPVDMEVLPGEVIPIAGGIEVLGAPGHTVGHVVFLWLGDGGVLFLGDAAKNVDGMVLSPIYEDRAQGIESLRTLGMRDFETACFAHGDAIVGGASEKIRQQWK